MTPEAQRRLAEYVEEQEARRLAYERINPPNKRATNGCVLGLFGGIVLTAILSSYGVTGGGIGIAVAIFSSFAVYLLAVGWPTR